MLYNRYYCFRCATIIPNSIDKIAVRRCKVPLTGQQATTECVCVEYTEELVVSIYTVDTVFTVEAHLVAHSGFISVDEFENHCPCVDGTAVLVGEGDNRFEILP